MDGGAYKRIHAVLLDLLEFFLPPLLCACAADLLRGRDAGLALRCEVAIAVLHAPAEVVLVERLFLAADGTGFVAHIP